MMRILPRLVMALCQISTEERLEHLLRIVRYLVEENRILRAKAPEKIALTPRERNRLLKFGLAIGPAIKEVITIVTPRTFMRWVKSESGRKVPARKRGRRPTLAQVRELIVRLARENAWGYTRILGELKKLRRQGKLAIKVSRSTVVNILNAAGLDPGPKRGEGTWDEFIRIHLRSLWACDFFTQRVLTLRGWVDYYFMLFIHVGSRRLFITPATLHPTGQWMAQQARNFLMHVEEQGLQATHLIVDNDTKFCEEFEKALAPGVEMVPTSLMAPNMNPYAERAVQTVQLECLDHFIVLGERHLNHLVHEFLEHYHKARPHQGLGNVTLDAAEAGDDAGDAASANEPVRLEEIVCQERLGGLLKHHYRRAA